MSRTYYGQAGEFRRRAERGAGGHLAGHASAVADRRGAMAAAHRAVRRPGRPRRARPGPAVSGPGRYADRAGPAAAALGAARVARRPGGQRRPAGYRARGARRGGHPGPSAGGRPGRARHRRDRGRGTGLFRRRRAAAPAPPAGLERGAAERGRAGRGPARASGGHDSGGRSAAHLLPSAARPALGGHAGLHGPHRDRLACRARGRPRPVPALRHGRGLAVRDRGGDGSAVGRPARAREFAADDHLRAVPGGQGGARRGRGRTGSGQPGRAAPPCATRHRAPARGPAGDRRARRRTGRDRAAHRADTPREASLLIGRPSLVRS